MICVNLNNTIERHYPWHVYILFQLQDNAHFDCLVAREIGLILGQNRTPDIYIDFVEWIVILLWSHVPDLYFAFCLLVPVVLSRPSRA